MRDARSRSLRLGGRGYSGSTMRVWFSTVPAYPTLGRVRAGQHPRHVARPIGRKSWPACRIRRLCRTRPPHRSATRAWGVGTASRLPALRVTASAPGVGEDATASGLPHPLRPVWDVHQPVSNATHHRFADVGQSRGLMARSPDTNAHLAPYRPVGARLIGTYFCAS